MVFMAPTFNAAWVLQFLCLIPEPKACGKPEQPPNSTMVAKNFNVGAVIDYTCDEGHLLVGPASRTCLPTGFYNEFPPVCKRKYNILLAIQRRHNVSIYNTVLCGVFLIKDSTFEHS